MVDEMNGSESELKWGAMEVNFEDEVNEAAAMKTSGGMVKNLADQVEKALGLLRQGGEPGENEMRQRLLVTGTLALKELVELVPRVPIRTRARILETLVKLAAQESNKMAGQHTHVHMEKHEHLHWEGSQLQAAAKAAEEQDRLRERAAEG